VSAGPNQVSVPPVSGLSSANAKLLLEGDAYGFVVTITNEDNATVPKGNAVRTDPAQGKLADKGSPITLFVSNGPAQVTVPPLGNLTESAARAKITNLGLVPDVSYASVPNGDPSNGRVIAQSPSEGNKVDPGSTVRIKVAKALPPPTTTTSTTVPPTTLPPTTTLPATTTTHT
jgi:serine/threonine-protein kinase